MGNGGKFLFGAGVVTGLGVLIANATKAAPAPHPVMHVGSINITVTPADATLTLNGQPISSGLTSNLPVGTYSLVASATGYVTKTISVIVSGDGITTVAKITLVAVTPVTGTVNIAITPAGYALLIDGNAVTATQITLSAGSHTWQASKTGYVTQNGTVNVIAGQPVPLNAALVAVVAGKGTVNITVTPAAAVVTIAGNTVTGTSIQLDPGNYPWTVSADGYTPQSGNLTVTANQPTPLTVNLIPIAVQYGQVAFVGHPISTIFNVDGTNYNPGFAQFPVGTYNYTASAAGYVSQSGQFTVVPSGITVAVTLQPSGGGQAFRIDTPVASSYLSWTGSVWNAVHFSDVATNDAQTAVTHTMTLMRHYRTSSGGESGDTPVQDSNGNVISQVVTLAPTGQQGFDFYSGYYSTVFPVGGSCDLWLQDELGNKGPVATIS